jgi:serine/threonine protein kinase
MEVYCTRPTCPRPENSFPELDDPETLKTVSQKYCITCGMHLILGDRYVPIKLLGKGGFGAAFLARDRQKPRIPLCVVKQFKPAFSLTTTQLAIAQKKFEEEAEVLEELGSQHNQIPALYASFTVKVPSWQQGQEEQLFYLVQEYIDGSTLEEEAAEKGKFSEEEIIEVLIQILKVLQFVHSRDKIHRDIKPSNIMRRRDGRLFLLDFGAVKQVTNSPTGSSTGIYSQGFAPPEQMNASDVYPSTDLYALAVTVITLFTNQEPSKLFDSFSNQWKWGSIPVSKQLKDILDKMLQPAASQRFQSANEVLLALSGGVTLPPKPQQQPHQQPHQQPQQQSAQQPQQQLQQQPPQHIQPARPQFTTLELLAGAAFSGFEGALVAIASYSVLKNPFFTVIVAGVIIAGLVFAQREKWIGDTWVDRLMIPGVTFAIIYFVPFLHAGLGISQIIIFAIAGGLIAVALTSLFRLVYNLLSLLL